MKPPITAAWDAHCLIGKFVHFLQSIQWESKVSGLTYLN